MQHHRIFLKEIKPNKIYSLSNSNQKNLDDKSKIKIKKEIFDLININMENLKLNLNDSKTIIDIDNQLNTIDKENFINYNGENISIISNSNSEIYSENEDNEESEKNIKNIFQYENSDNNNVNDNDITIQEKYLSRNLPIFDSNSTSNTYKKKVNNISINKMNNKISCSPNSEKNNANMVVCGEGDIKKFESELINFFWEINLPSSYAFKFIENGFDDLNILIEMAKTGNAISNQNLKDIGILKAGERAKILIHLEEKAGIFPFPLEKNIIYNNIYNDENLNSLNKFLEKCNCIKYINNFIINGYWNSELLFTQMLSKEPINEEILSKDFNINKKNDLDNIMKGLEDGSKIYLKKLKTLNTKYSLDVKSNYKYSCDSCLII